MPTTHPFPGRWRWPRDPLAAAIRLTRGYLTAVDTETSFFCRSDDGEGACRIVASGSAVFQAEGLVGILVRF
jgi:hypothetical protein